MMMMPLGPLHNEDGSVNIRNVMRMHRFVQYNSWQRWKTSDRWGKEHPGQPVPKEKIPKEEFYSREFMEIMTSDKNGILEKIPVIDENGNKSEGLPEKAAKIIRLQADILPKTSLTEQDREKVRAVLRKYLAQSPMADCFSYMKGEFRTIPDRETDDAVPLFSEGYTTPAEASAKCITPLAPIYRGGRFDFDAFMREHRYVLHMQRVAYARSKSGEEQLPPVHYSKNFLVALTMDKFGLHETLGLKGEKADYIKGFSGILTGKEIRQSELDRLERTVEWVLAGNPKSSAIIGEFVEDRRTDEEKTMDLFLKENPKRKYTEPFSQELMRGVVRPEFLARIAVPYTAQEIDKDSGDVVSKEYPGTSERDIRNLQAGAGAVNSGAMTGSQAVEFSKKIGYALCKCGFAKERVASRNKRERREISPSTGMRGIYSELRLECGEMYADRNPSRGKYKGKLGTRFSDGLLLTVTDAKIMEALGIGEGKDISAKDPGMEFLADSYTLKVPLADKSGIRYPSVSSAMAASATEDIARRREIAAMKADEIWKTPEAASAREKEGAFRLHEFLVKKKFETNPDIAEKLTDTGDARLLNRKGLIDTTLTAVRKSLAEAKGLKSPDATWFRDWRQKILANKDNLKQWWDDLKEGEKDSLNYCLDTFVTEKFREYKERHPEQFPQNAGWKKDKETFSR